LWVKHSSKLLGAKKTFKGHTMATVIRLTRMGRKKQPFYRIAVTDSRKRRDGGWIELIGYYNPMTDPITTKVDEERLNYWLSVGAQMSDRVKKITGK
jgi:small subunit ribosomal protein S16